MASKKWNVSRVTRHKFDITFVVLWDGCSCWVSVAQWLAQQHPSAKAPARAPWKQNTHPSILMILGTSCKQTMMGEVECPIRLYGVLAVPQSKPGGMGVSHKTTYTGDCWWHISGPAYLVDELSLTGMTTWGQSKILEFGRWKLEVKKNMASGKWNVSRVSPHEFDISFALL